MDRAERGFLRAFVRCFRHPLLAKPPELPRIAFAYRGLGSASLQRFNDRKLRGYELIELQADEIRTFVGSKDNVVWLFAVIEVWSRLWPSFRIGRRWYRNTAGLFSDVVSHGQLTTWPLIATDGFEYYFAVVRRLLGHACVFGQVIKKRRKDRVVRVDRRLAIGTQERLDEALLKSEDSQTLNTSFIERLNLTIRQGSAYLSRRTPCHARCKDRLRQHVELLRCYYNFVRPHRGLKLGTTYRTPAMQAGLARKRLSFREIFTASHPERCRVAAVVRLLPRTGQQARPQDVLWAA